MHITRTLREMLFEWYFVRFSYADNRLCMFLERFFDKKYIRMFAFSAYVITMTIIFVTLGALLFSHAGQLVDIILNRGSV